MEQFGIYDMLDYSCAENLGVSVQVFTEKIERLSEYRMSVLIEAILSDDEKTIERAKRVFNLIN